MTTLPDDDWVPQSCTLPTVGRPVRRAAFDELFARDVLAVRRESARRLVLALRPGAETASRAAGLAAQETGCCSFFTFDLVVGGGTTALGITTPAGHDDVLAALGARAEARAGAAS